MEMNVMLTPLVGMKVGAGETAAAGPRAANDVQWRRAT